MFYAFTFTQVRIIYRPIRTQCFSPPFGKQTSLMETKDQKVSKVIWYGTLCSPLTMKEKKIKQRKENLFLQFTNVYLKYLKRWKMRVVRFLGQCSIVFQCHRINIWMKTGLVLQLGLTKTSIPMTGITTARVEAGYFSPTMSICSSVRQLTSVCVRVGGKKRLTASPDQSSSCVRIQSPVDLPKHQSSPSDRASSGTALPVDKPITVCLHWFSLSTTRSWQTLYPILPGPDI